MALDKIFQFCEFSGKILNLLNQFKVEKKLSKTFHKLFPA